MALQPITGLILQSLPDGGTLNAGQTINAVGESYGVIGRVRIPGNATGKVISAAGNGQILWMTGAVTWATAGSKIRVGIQDVDTSTGLEDGTFDVYRELTQGADAISASVYRADTMNNGTKTLSDGDLIAIVVEMTVRNGADSIQVQGTVGPTGAAVSNFAFGHPYGSIDTGALARSSTNLLYAVIKFDDGTSGAIQGIGPVRITTAAAITFNVGSSPDEYCGTFIPNFKLRVCGISIALSSVGAGDNLDLILYSDPYGSPTVVQSVTVDPDVVAQAATPGPHTFPIPVSDLAAGTAYGVAVRPTTAGNINVNYADLSAGSAGLAAVARTLLPLPSLKFAGRTNQTGAFTEVSTDNLPYIALDVCGLDDGLGGGGGPAFGNSRSRVVNPVN